MSPTAFSWAHACCPPPGLWVTRSRLHPRSRSHPLALPGRWSFPSSTDSPPLGEIHKNANTVISAILHTTSPPLSPSSHTAHLISLALLL